MNYTIKRGTCESCGHVGGLVPMTTMCGCCTFGEFDAMAEYDERIGETEEWVASAKGGEARG